MHNTTCTVEEVENKRALKISPLACFAAAVEEQRVVCFKKTLARTVPLLMVGLSINYDIQIARPVFNM
jgi:hypothetical protein